MRLRDVFTAETIAQQYTEAAGNSEPYLGDGFFPPKKKMGLDLKWIKGYKGLPVSLMPSNFDAKSTFRDRVGIEVTQTQMAYFKESMLVKEEDEQEIMRVKDSGDPYAEAVLDRIFDDSTNLVEGAKVVIERMRMQLLAPMGGSMGIAIKANGVNYTYNYDPDGEWKKAHYVSIETEADKWTAKDTCDPIRDMEALLDMQEASDGGNRPEVLLMSKATFNLMKNSAKVRSGVLAQNTTANINYTSSIVKNYVEEALNVSIVIYTKPFKDETGSVKKYYPDNIIMAMPKRSIGNSWYGTTPAERTLMGDGDHDVSLVDTGVAVEVSTTTDPVNTKTTVSEIVLPSFEQMNECAAIEVA